MRNEIKFKNGSKIIFLSSKENQRSTRCELVTFYCNICKTVHVDHKIKEITIIDDNLMFCNESYENVLKPFLKS